MSTMAAQRLAKLSYSRLTGTGVPRKSRGAISSSDSSWPSMTTEFRGSSTSSSTLALASVLVPRSNASFLRPSVVWPMDSVLIDSVPAIFHCVSELDAPLVELRPLPPISIKEVNEGGLPSWQTKEAASMTTSHLLCGLLSYVPALKLSASLAVLSLTVGWSTTALRCCCLPCKGRPCPKLSGLRARTALFGSLMAGGNKMFGVTRLDRLWNRYMLTLYIEEKRQSPGHALHLSRQSRVTRSRYHPLVRSLQQALLSLPSGRRELRYRLPTQAPPT